MKSEEDHHSSRRKRDGAVAPKNALEERYRKSYFERHRDDEERKSRRSVVDGKDHSEDFSKKIVRFREPTLSKDNERPILRGRRNSWKTKDIEE